MAHQKAYPCRQTYAPKHARDSLPRARRWLRCRRREDGQEEARHTDVELRRRSCDEDGVQKGETVGGAGWGVLSNLYARHCEGFVDLIVLGLVLW